MTPPRWLGSDRVRAGRILTEGNRNIKTFILTAGKRENFKEFTGTLICKTPRGDQLSMTSLLGKEKEHWLDPDFEFCSCSGFYFGMLKDNSPCYHIECIKIAKKQERYERIDFSDDEFESFMSGLINDL